jgi:hypothetical protein
MVRPSKKILNIADDYRFFLAGYSTVLSSQRLYSQQSLYVFTFISSQDQALASDLIITVGCRYHTSKWPPWKVDYYHHYIWVSKPSLRVLFRLMYSSGITLTGFGVITAWITLIITVTPSLIRKIRQQREWANNAYYRDDIESGEIEEERELEDTQEKNEYVEEVEMAKKKPKKKSNKRGWFSSRRGDRPHRSRSDERRYEDKRSTKRHRPSSSSRSRSSKDRYRRDRRYDRY